MSDEKGPARIEYRPGLGSTGWRITVGGADITEEVRHITIDCDRNGPTATLVLKRPVVDLDGVEIGTTAEP